AERFGGFGRRHNPLSYLFSSKGTEMGQNNAVVHSTILLTKPVPSLSKGVNSGVFPTLLDKKRQIIYDFVVIHQQNLLISELETAVLRSQLVNRAAGKRILSAPSQFRQIKIRGHGPLTVIPFLDFYVRDDSPEP